MLDYVNGVRSNGIFYNVSIPKSPTDSGNNNNNIGPSGSFIRGINHNNSNMSNNSNNNNNVDSKKMVEQEGNPSVSKYEGAI